MKLKDALIDAISKDSWVPYEGDYGGSGWINAQTGEIRYQEEKPAPGEGGGDDGGYGAYEGEAEMGETIEEPVDDFGPVNMDAIGEGDSVVVDNGDQSVAAEVLGVGDEEIEVDMGDYGAVSMPAESVLGTPMAEPPDGFASGWTPIPEDTTELEYGSAVELYDVNEGEYVAGEIDTVDPEFNEEGQTYVSVQTDDDVYEFLDGEGVGSGENAMLTAAEDPGGNAVHYIEDATDLADVEEGNYIQYEMEGEMQGATVEEVYESPFAEGYDAKLDDGTILQADIDAQDPVLWQDQQPSPFEGDDGVLEIEDEGDIEEFYGFDGVLYPDQYEAVEGTIGPPEKDGEYARFYPDEGTTESYRIDEQYDLGHHDLAVEMPEWQSPGEVFPDRGVASDLIDETLSQWDHPTEGEVAGEVDVTVDSQGNRWYHLDEGVSFTDNPDHPTLYTGDTLTGVEDPWVGPDDIDPFEDLKVGDKIEVSGELEEVAQVGDEQIKLAESGWVADADLNGRVSRVALQDSIEPPDEYTEWEDVVDVDDAGNVDLASFDPEDTVYYYDEEAGSLRTGTVEDQSPDDIDGVVLDDGTEVPRDRMEGYAPTGTPPVPEATHSLDAVQVGYEAEISYLDNGELVEARGMVTDETDGSITITDADGETHRVGPHDDYAITGADHDPDMGEWGYGDGMETPTEEITDHLSERVDLEPGTPAGEVKPAHNYLSKGRISKQKQKELKGELSQWFNPAEVDEFYEAIHSWKSSSSSAAKLESAFAHALGLESRIRSTSEGSGIPFSEDELGEWTKIAEVANDLSQQHYESHVGEWYRGGSGTSMKSLINEWADNPDAGEFNFDGRALNNGDDDPNNNWNRWRMAPGDRVDADQIGLCTDMMFNPQGNHQGESEVWATADGMTIRPDEVHLSHNSSYNLEGDISDWSRNQTKGVAEEVAKVYDSLLQEGYNAEVSRPTEFSDQQVETFAELAAKAKQENVHTDSHVKEFVAEATAMAEERGVSVAGLGTGADGFDEAADFTEEAEVVAYSPFTGEPVDAVITDVHEDLGIINAEDYETGQTLELEPEDIEEVVWSPDGAHKDDAEYLDGYEDEGIVALPDKDFEATDLSGGDTIVFDDGFDQEPAVVDYAYPNSGKVDLEMGGSIQAEDIVGIEESSPAVTHLDPQPADEVDTSTPVADGYSMADFEEAVGDWDEEGVEVYYQTMDGGHEYGHVKGVYGDELLIYPDSQTEDEVDPSDVVEVYDEQTMADKLGPDGDYDITGNPDAFNAYDPDGFSPGTTVPVDGFDMDEVTIGDAIETSDGMQGTIVDVTSGGDPQVHVDDQGENLFVEEGDIDTFYPSDGVEVVGSSDGGSDDWQTQYEQAAEAHLNAESGTDEYWDTYDEAQNALPADVGEEVTIAGQTFEISDFDPENGDESVEIWDPDDGYSEWVAPHQINWDSSEGSDEEALDPAELHEQAPAVMDEVTLNFPGGPAEAMVMDHPEDPDGPLEVNDENNDDWLVWPDGDLEPV